MAKIRTIFAPRDEEQTIGVLFTEPSRTQQQFADEADINILVENALRTGDTSVFTPPDMDYLDLSDVGDYQASLDYLNDINENFRELPATIRAKFNNNPAEYADFVVNPANLDECVELGILQGSAEPARPAPAGVEQPAVAPDAETEN